MSNTVSMTIGEMAAAVFAHHQPTYETDLAAERAAMGTVWVLDPEYHRPVELVEADVQIAAESNPEWIYYRRPVTALMAVVQEHDPADVVAWHAAQNRPARERAILRRKLAAVRTRNMVRGA